MSKFVPVLSIGENLELPVALGAYDNFRNSDYFERRGFNRGVIYLFSPGVYVYVYRTDAGTVVVRRSYSASDTDSATD